MKSQPVGISYMRFSALAQQTGDSIRRQTALRDAWLKQNKITLDESLSKEDHGASAFLGDHTRNPDRFALAAFLSVAEQPGRIPEGSFLIVENLDRLTREDIRHAVGLLFRILDCKINVVTLAPERVFYYDKFEMTDMMLAVIELSRAHGESARKSERLKATWGEKKKKAETEKKPSGRVIPAWVEVVGPDGKPLPLGIKFKEVVGAKFRLKPEAAKVVQQIFRWAIDGDGVTAIVQKLNDSGTPPIAPKNKPDARRKTGRQWVGSYVLRILSSRATFGEHVPGYYSKKHVIARKGDPIPNYFPAAITEDDFHRARAAISSRRGNRGRVKTQDASTFTGLLFDMRTGVRLHLHTSSPGRRYLTPATARLTKETAVERFPFGVFEEAILNHLREIDPRELLPPDQSAQDVLALTGRRLEVLARIQELKGQMMSGKASISILADVAQTLEQQAADLNRQLGEAQNRAASPLASAWGEAGGLMAAVHEGGEKRVRLRAALRRVVERIDCLFCTDDWDKYAVVEVLFTGGHQRTYTIAHRPQSRTKPPRTITESWVEIDGIDTLPAGDLTGKEYDPKTKITALERWMPETYGRRLRAAQAAEHTSRELVPGVRL